MECCLVYLQPVSKGVYPREQGGPGGCADGQGVEVVQDNAPACQTVQHVGLGTWIVPRDVIHSCPSDQEGGSTNRMGQNLPRNSNVNNKLKTPVTGTKILLKL